MLRNFAATTIKSRINYIHPRFSVSASTPKAAASPFPVPVIDFTDTQNAYKDKTFEDLLRGALVYSICQIKPVVFYADRLIKMSYAVIGSTATDLVLKKTFFGHFCAGEDEKTIMPTINMLDRNGIGKDSQSAHFRSRC
jgi:hypothetical protein